MRFSPFRSCLKRVSRPQDLYFMDLNKTLDSILLRYAGQDSGVDPKAARGVATRWRMGFWREIEGESRENPRKLG